MPPLPMMMPPPPPPPATRQAAGPAFGEPAAKRFAAGAPPPPVPVAAAPAPAPAPAAPLHPPPPLPPATFFVLEPEEEFAERVGGASTPVTVDVELEEGSDGTKKTISVSAPGGVSTTVSELKALLAPISGIATNKQKLSRPNVGVMADGFSLAHYNVGEGEGKGKVVLSLSAKQRAARKKG